MTEAAKPRADWEAIERDYRAGSLSLREIAKQHGVTDGAIRKWAKKNGVERDLTEKVRQKVRNELVRSEVRTENNLRTEAATVDYAVKQQVEVVFGQRKLISRLKKVALALLEELDEQTISRELYEELGEMLRSEDEKGQDKRNDLYNKLISGAGRVDSIKKLAETMKIIIGLERQAFNIGDEPPKQEDALSALISTIAAKGSRLPIAAEPTDMES